MEFNLKALSEAGAFTGPPVKKVVTWKTGKDTHTADVWVRRLPYHSAVGEVDAYRMGKDGMAARTAACIVDEKGAPVMTIADITGEADPTRGPLDAKLTMALLKVIGEVNDVGKHTGSPT